MIAFYSPGNESCMFKACVNSFSFNTSNISCGNFGPEFIVEPQKVPLLECSIKCEFCSSNVV